METNKNENIPNTENYIKNYKIKIRIMSDTLTIRHSTSVSETGHLDSPKYFL